METESQLLSIQDGYASYLVSGLNDNIYIYKKLMKMGVTIAVHTRWICIVPPSSMIIVTYI